MESLSNMCDSITNEVLTKGKFTFKNIKGSRYQYVRIDYKDGRFIGEYIVSSRRLVLVGNARKKAVLRFLHFFNIEPFTYDVVLWFDGYKINDFINGRLVSIGAINITHDIIIEGKRCYLNINSMRDFSIFHINICLQANLGFLTDNKTTKIALPPKNLEMLLIEIHPEKQLNDYASMILDAFSVNTQTVVAYLPESYYIIIKENTENLTELQPETGKWYEFVGRYFFDLTHKSISIKSARK